MKITNEKLLEFEKKMTGKSYENLEEMYDEIIEKPVDKYEIIESDVKCPRCKHTTTIRNTQYARGDEGSVAEHHCINRSCGYIFGME